MEDKSLMPEGFGKEEQILALLRVFSDLFFPHQEELVQLAYHPQLKNNLIIFPAFHVPSALSHVGVAYNVDEIKLQGGKKTALLLRAIDEVKLKEWVTAVMKEKGDQLSWKIAEEELSQLTAKVALVTKYVRNEGNKPNPNIVSLSKMLPALCSALDGDVLPLKTFLLAEIGFAYNGSTLPQFLNSPLGKQLTDFFKKLPDLCMYFGDFLRVQKFVELSRWLTYAREGKLDEVSDLCHTLKGLEIQKEALLSELSRGFMKEASSLLSLLTNAASKGKTALVEHCLLEGLIEKGEYTRRYVSFVNELVPYVDKITAFKQRMRFKEEAERYHYISKLLKGVAEGKVNESIHHRYAENITMLLRQLGGAITYRKGFPLPADSIINRTSETPLEVPPMLHIEIPQVLRELMVEKKICTVFKDNILTHINREQLQKAVYQVMQGNIRLTSKQALASGILPINIQVPLNNGMHTVPGDIRWEITDFVVGGSLAGLQREKGEQKRIEGEAKALVASYADKNEHLQLFVSKVLAGDVFLVKQALLKDVNIARGGELENFGKQLHRLVTRLVIFANERGKRDEARLFGNMMSVLDKAMEKSPDEQKEIGRSLKKNQALSAEILGPFYELCHKLFPHDLIVALEQGDKKTFHQHFSSHALLSYRVFKQHPLLGEALITYTGRAEGSEFQEVHDSLKKISKQEYYSKEEALQLLKAAGKQYAVMLNAKRSFSGNEQLKTCLKDAVLAHGTEQKMAWNTGKWYGEKHLPFITDKDIKSALRTYLSSDLFTFQSTFPGTTIRQMASALYKQVSKGMEEGVPNQNPSFSFGK